MADLKKYDYDGGDLILTEEQKRQYDEDGFIIFKNFASKKELDILEEAVTGPDAITAYAYGNEDGAGRKANMCLWNNAGDDSTGIWSRTKKMAYTAEQLLDGEIYHYHSKLMMKEAKTGGKFVWHQDYGYWYNFYCMFPDMLTVFLAIDRCGTDNGCLQVLKGSHKCGRIDHGVVKDQQGADLSRVAEIEKRLQTLNVELDPGDAMFFHCNLLHTSSANNSEHRRWALLTAYNKVSNSPYKESVHGMYVEPLKQVDNDALLKLGVNRNLKGKGIVTKKNGAYTVVDKD